MSLIAYVAEADQSDEAIIERIRTRMDCLADEIMASETPDIATYRALHGLVQWGNASGHLTPSVKHQMALRRLPAPSEMAAWAEQEARLAAIRGG